MNISHIKYAVEVAKNKSITKAAENLFMGQPNLSRSIKELEESIGIQIFTRTSKGVIPTEQGERFLSYAKNILEQIEEMEDLFQPRQKNMYKFSLSSARAEYITKAFAELVSQLDMSKEIEFKFREANNLRTINNVAQNNYNLGIIRYWMSEDKYYKKQLKEKKLSYKLIWEFDYILLMHKKHPLAEKENIEEADLSDYIEITSDEKYTSCVTASDFIKENNENHHGKKCIYVLERGSRLDLLSQIHLSYMWTSAVPDDILKKYSLVQKKCNKHNIEKCRDVLVYKNNYRINELETKFIEVLDRVRDETLKQFVEG